MIHHGDCLDVLPTMAADSVDAVCTDPPYGLEFMGKAWDKLDCDPAWNKRRGNGSGSIDPDNSRPSSRHSIRYGGKSRQFNRCVKCGKRQFSGSPCKCAGPSWTIEYPEGPGGRFNYCAKASSEDRCGSRHPCVKPVSLMRWLAKLICPPGGTILDPFAGSGTTLQAAMLEGFQAIGIEREAEYVADIQRRLAHMHGGDAPLFAA